MDDSTNCALYRTIVVAVLKTEENRVEEKGEHSISLEDLDQLSGTFV